MFVYIDESGHTGKKNSDENQPVFSYMALASKKNLDLDLDFTIRNLLKRNNISELHGSELGNNIEFIASDILHLLNFFFVYFCVSVVEKDFLSYAKLYDTIFDNVENKGARFQTYQIRSNRLFMLNNFCYITPIKTAHNFYENCLFANNEEQAIKVLVETCNTILTNLDDLKDDRSKEIIGDALTWAKENPKEITTFNTRKIDRWRHLPHVVGFLPIMSMLSEYSKKHKTKINKIIHDEQQQIKKVITEIHELISNKNTPMKWDLQENGYYELSQIKETNFEIKDSRNSFGLQVVDICLYVILHQSLFEKNVIDFPKTAMLSEYIKKHNEPFYVTMDFFQFEAKLLYDKIMNHDFTEEELQKGKGIVEQMEKNHKNQNT